MKRNSIRRLTSVVSSLFLLIVPMAPAWAHAILVKAIPAQDASVGSTPDKVELWFNEGVGQEYAALAVIDSNGARVDAKDARRGALDPSYLSVGLTKLAGGTYTVRYRVLSADGHVVSGKYNFSIQTP